MKRNLIYTDNIFLRFILCILSFVYLFFNRLKYYIFYLKIFPKTKLSYSKVISVGNITIGGTGKTPFSIWIGKKLKEKGKKIAVIFRAYKSEKSYGEVYDGEKFLMNIKEAGDEPYVLAYNLKCPVFIGKYRAKLAKYIEEKYSPDYIILDDGFQYWRLERDFDIVCVDGNEYLYNEKIVPCGILREPKSALKRADFFVVKKTSDITELDKEKCEEFSKYAPCYFMKYKYEIVNEEFLKKAKNILVFAGIAKALPFFERVKSLFPDKKLYFEEFSDHENYDEIKIEEIKKICVKYNIEALICTEKDFVKLDGKLKNLSFLKLKPEVLKGEEIVEEIVSTDNSRRH